MNIVEELEKAANSVVLNKAISNLSEKFGVATDNIMNSVIRYGRTSSIISMVIYLVVLIISIYIFTISLKYIKKRR